VTIGTPLGFTVDRAGKTIEFVATPRHLFPATKVPYSPASSHGGTV
jgi:hypothetical protein